MKVLYVTCEQFTNDYIDAIRSNFKENAVSVFRDKYRNVDVLLVDDIQLLQGAKKSQGEFFKLFNQMYDNNKLIVIGNEIEGYSTTCKTVIEDVARDVAKLADFKTGMILYDISNKELLFKSLIKITLYSSSSSSFSYIVSN